MKHVITLFLCVSMNVGVYAQTNDLPKNHGLKDLDVVRLENELQLKSWTNKKSEAIIKATKDTSIIANYPGSVQVITKEEIEKIPAKDITDILRSVSGLQVNKRSTEDFDIDARGFNNGGGNGSRMILLINGMPAKNGDTGSLDWSLVDINEIEKIEIAKGNLGSMYGDGAIAGVINIITSRKPKHDSSSFNLTYGSYNKLGTFLTLNKNLKYGFYNIKIDYKKSDGYRQSNTYEKKNLKFGIEHSLNPKTEIEGYLNYNEANYTFPGSITKEQMAKFTERGAVSGNIIKQDFNIFLFNGKMIHQYNSSTWVTLFSGYKDRKYSYPLWGTSYKNKLYNIELQGEKIFSLMSFKNRFIIGGELKREDMFATWVNTHDITSAGYLQNIISWHEKIIISSSYRFDLIENNYQNSISLIKKIYKLDNAKIGLLFRHGANNEIYINASKNFRAPTRDEVFDYSSGSLFILEPEKALTYETGFRASPFAFIKWQENIYYMKVKNEIIGSQLWLIPNKNMNEVTHKGLESNLELSPHKLVNINLSHTWQKTYFSKGDYTNKIVPLAPESRFSAIISLFPIKGIVISHSSRWQNQCYVANDYDNKFNPLKAFSVSDLKIMYQHHLGKIGFSIYNLYNENYSEFAGITPDYSNWLDIAYDIGYYPSPRRNYELSVSLFF